MLKSLIAAAVLAAAPFAAHAAVIPTHSFDLNGDLADSLGSATLTTSGGTLGASGYTFAAGQGLTLSGAFPSGDVYSVELYFRFDSLSTYGRVLNSSGTDNGLYIQQNGGPKVNYYEGTPNVGASFSLGDLHHLVFTRDTSGSATYVDGALALSTNAFASQQIPGALRLFIDDQTENSPGYVDFIQTYDTALTGGQVTALYNDGHPGPYVASGAPEPAAWALMIAGFGGAGVALRRRRSLAV